MGRIISIHEYDLKPEVDMSQFESTFRDAEARGLLQLPGLVAHHFVKGAKGVRRGAYAALWIYESREAWERLWAPPSIPGPRESIRTAGGSGRRSFLLPFSRTTRTVFRFTSYEELVFLRPTGSWCSNDKGIER